MEMKMEIVPFFKVICHLAANDSDLRGICVGFENGDWRKRQLVEYLINFIPEFALTYSELAELSPLNMVKILKQALCNIYKTEKFKNRGELGEIMLHAILREGFNTVPVISKIFYKDSPNDTVKGFDAVHVVINGDDLELWIGEVKFYSSIHAAIRDVTKEIQEHIQTDYLRQEFLAITNKIDNNWPHAEKLKRLLDPNVSLDEVFVRACIPVLLTYDSTVIAKYNKHTDSYLEEIQKEFERLYMLFLEKIGKKVPLQIHLFLLPLKTKQELVDCFDERLKELQKI